MTLWDTHCHLADARFGPDRPEVCARAAAAGVEAVVVVAADPPAWAAAGALRAAEGGPALRFAFGLHPHEARTASEALWVELRGHLAAGAAALGEIGLDQHHDLSPPAAQRSAFERQLRLAADLGLPVILHERRAAAPVLAMLRATGLPAAGGVWHCFSGDPAVAEEALALGLHLGFGGLATFPRDTAGVRAAAAACPADRLLLETDAPYLSPVPHRGRRNEPARVADVLGFLAALRGEAPERLAAATSANARRLFGGAS